MMKVQALSPRGYCYGVINAIKTAKKARSEHPDEKVYLLGMIVHNKFIAKALENLNIITLNDKEKSRFDLIDDIDEGVVVLTAHGTDTKVYDKAQQKGLTIYDATCQDVLKTHYVIEDYLNQGYEVIYYGTKNHPEALAAISINPDKIHFISDVDDLAKLDLNPDTKLVLTNQTTLSILDTETIFQAAKKRFPNIMLVAEICNATRLRQEAVMKIEDDVDIAFVVGDRFSNNANKLASVIKKQKDIDVYLIESIDDLDLNLLHNKKKAAVTSGASTPTYITNMVIEFLQQYDENDDKTHVKPEIDITKII